MQFGLTEDQTALKEAAGRFARDVLLPGYRKREDDAVIGNVLIREMGRLGLVTPSLPERYGGMGIDGVTAGLLSFIPYVGAIVGGGLAIGLAFFQFWGEWGWIGAVAAIFFAGQLLEGNFLTPKLVGDSVGLHPVWLIFALSVFGSLFGFVGLLVAVPVTAALGVLVRFMMEQYMQGRLYRGKRPSEENPEEKSGKDQDPWPDS